MNEQRCKNHEPCIKRFLIWLKKNAVKQVKQVKLNHTKKKKIAQSSIMSYRGWTKQNNQFYLSATTEDGLKALKLWSRKKKLITFSISSKQRSATQSSSASNKRNQHPIRRRRTSKHTYKEIQRKACHRYLHHLPNQKRHSMRIDHSSFHQ